MFILDKHIIIYPLLDCQPYIHNGRPIITHVELESVWLQSKSRMDFQISKVSLFIVVNVFAIQASKLDMNFIVAVIDEFQMRNPTIWNRQNELGIDLMKILFHQLGQYCKMKTNLAEMEGETSDMLLLFNDMKEIESYFQMESNSKSTHAILLQKPDFKTILNWVTTSNHQ